MDSYIDKIFTERLPSTAKVGFYELTDGERLEMVAYFTQQAGRVQALAIELLSEVNRLKELLSRGEDVLTQLVEKYAELCAINGLAANEVEAVEAIHAETVRLMGLGSVHSIN